MKVDDIIDGIMSLGRGTLLAKFDVELFPSIHPNDRYLFGMQGNHFVDMALPFGLHSALYICDPICENPLKTR